MNTKELERWALTEQAKRALPYDRTDVTRPYPFAGTPWGAPQHVDSYVPGRLYFVTTSSHGGFWIPPSAIPDLPEAVRNWKGDGRTAHYGRGSGCEWWEEDVDANIPIALHGEVFDPYACFCAWRTIRHRDSDYWPLDLLTHEFWDRHCAVAQQKAHAFLTASQDVYERDGAHTNGSGWTTFFTGLQSRLRFRLHTPFYWPLAWVRRNELETLGVQLEPSN